MAWFTRVSRFGDVHAVFGQEQKDTCALACAIMAAFKVNKFIPGAPALFSEAEILNILEKMGIPNPVGSGGLLPSELSRLLNAPELGMPGWQYENCKPTIRKAILEKVGVASGVGPVHSVTPVIVSIVVNNVCHVVLVDTVRTYSGKKYATVCNPWDAHVHIVSLEEDGEDGLLNDIYTGTKLAFGVDSWGRPPMGVYPWTGVTGRYIGGIHWRS